jgi:predicted outer membrane repeat protein
MKTLIATILFLITIFLSVIVNCDDYFVDTVVGNDTANDGSHDAPWRTITFTLSNVVCSSDNPAIIYIAEGYYNLNNGEKLPLMINDNIYLIGSDKKYTILSGDNKSSLIVCKNASNIKISNLTITNGIDNSSWGGAIYCLSSTVMITDCNINKNYSTGSGGAVYCLNNSILDIEDCTINDNKAEDKGGAIYGLNSTLMIKNCLFQKNFADKGGTILFEESSVDFEDCSILDNNALDGGGLYGIKSQTSIKRCHIDYNHGFDISGGVSIFESPQTIIEDSTINYNGIEQIYCQSGGLYCENSKVYLFDCEIIGNTALGGVEKGWSGGLYSFDSDVTIYNSQIYKNSSYDSKAFIPAIVGKNSNFSIFYSNILDNSGIQLFDGCSSVIIDSIIRDNNLSFLGNPAKIFYCNTDCVYGGVGNINADPLFVSGPRGSYYLSQNAAGQDFTSLCVNSGCPLPIIGALMNVDNMTTRTDGVLDCDRIDIGYHYKPPVLLNLEIKPEQDVFKKKDKIEISIDVDTAPVENIVDLYFIMQDPMGSIYSAMNWDEGLYVSVPDLTLIENLVLDDLFILEASIPSDIPQIKKSGSYTFAVFVTLQGKTDPISNIAAKSIKVDLYSNLWSYLQKCPLH